MYISTYLSSSPSSPCPCPRDDTLSGAYVCCCCTRVCLLRWRATGGVCIGNEWRASNKNRKKRERKLCGIPALFLFATMCFFLMRCDRAIHELLSGVHPGKAGRQASHATSRNTARTLPTCLLACLPACLPSRGWPTAARTRERYLVIGCLPAIQSKINKSVGKLGST